MDDHLRAKLVSLATNDRSPYVRLHLASLLQRLAIADRMPLLQALAAHAEDNEDPNLPLMLWYGAEPLVMHDPVGSLQLAYVSRISRLQQFIVRRAAGHDASLPHVVAEIQRSEELTWQKLLLTEIVRGMDGRVGVAAPENWPNTYKQLRHHHDSMVRELADEVAAVLGTPIAIDAFRARLVDRAAETSPRLRALQMLIRARDPELAHLLPILVDDAPVRSAVIVALAQFNSIAAIDRLVDQFSNLAPNEQQALVDTLCARASYAQRLVQGLEKGTVPRSAVSAYHVRQLLAIPDAELHARFEQVWGQVREVDQDRQRAIEQWKEFLSTTSIAQASPAQGRQLYVTHCANCHRLFGEGGDVGPDLTGSNRANLDYLLQNILDPSAVVGNDYRLTVVQTGDGRVISGIIKRRTDSALTLRTLTDTVVVPLVEIDASELLPQSMMPESLLDKLSREQVRDLVAYLGSPQQVPVAPNDTSKLP